MARAGSPTANSPPKRRDWPTRFVASGVEPGARVAYLCPNTAELLIAHFAVPLAGAVLVAINTRLAPEEVKYICDHAGARMLVVDHSLLSTVEEIEEPFASVEEVVAIGPERTGRLRYDELLARGSDEAAGLDTWRMSAPRSRSTTRPAPLGGRRG